MGVVDGQVAFITGAARGQGRAHAVRLAHEGADIVAVDICEPIATIPYPMATEADLEETARLVEAEGRRIIARRADVRDASALAAVVADGVERFGRLDIVVANAGIAPIGGDGSVADDQVWQDVIGVNMTGVWNTVRVSTAAIIAGGRGGSIVLTSSTAGLKGGMNRDAGDFAYTASKHGVVGLMRSFALGLAPHSIRVNTVLPTGVSTPMLMNDAVEAFMGANPELAADFKNPLPVDMITAEDVADAVLWLVSPAAKYVTGVALPVDAGFTAR
jgi:SDR family mycofactocin-dependent oxidoreductase